MSGAEAREHLVEVCLGNFKSYLFHVNVYCLWYYLLQINQIIFRQV